MVSCREGRFILSLECEAIKMILESHLETEEHRQSQKDRTDWITGTQNYF